MRWPWSKPKPLPIPEYRPVHVVTEHAPKEAGIVVEEIDTSDMTKTGVHKAWDRLSGRFKE